MAKKKARKRSSSKTKTKPAMVPRVWEAILVFVAVAVYAWFVVNMVLNPSLLLDPVFALVVGVCGFSLLFIACFYAYKLWVK
ncbi:hypothetical protein ACFLQ2_03105 [archaeon]